MTHAGAVTSSQTLFDAAAELRPGIDVERHQPRRLRASFLDETNFVARFLGMIDLFIVWWLVVLGHRARRALQAQDRPDLLVAHGASIVVIVARASRASCAHSQRSRSVSRKKWFIALVVIVLLAAVVGANFYFKKSDAASAINAEAREEARPRGDRLGLGQDPGEALREHQRRADGPRHAAGRRGRRPRQGRPVPAARSTRTSLRGTVQRGEAAVAGARGRRSRRPGSTSRPRARTSRSRATRLKRQRDSGRSG